MKVIGERIAKLYPDSNKGWGVTVDRFEDRIVGDQMRQSLYVLLAARGESREVPKKVLDVIKHL